jgi:hypothetical protein
MICRTDRGRDREHRGGTDTGGHNARPGSNVPTGRTRWSLDGNNRGCGTLGSNRRQAICLVGGGLVDF